MHSRVNSMSGDVALSPLLQAHHLSSLIARAPTHIHIQSHKRGLLSTLTRRPPNLRASVPRCASPGFLVRAPQASAEAQRHIHRLCTSAYHQDLGGALPTQPSPLAFKTITRAPASSFLPASCRRSCLLHSRRPSLCCNFPFELSWTRAKHTSRSPSFPPCLFSIPAHRSLATGQATEAPVARQGRPPRTGRKATERERRRRGGEREPPSSTRLVPRV